MMKEQMIMHNGSLSSMRCARGSVFFYILLGIALFSALAFTVSRGMRGQQTKAMSARQAELAASDIFTYSKKVSHAVDRLRQNGCSESELSFAFDSDDDNSYQDSDDDYYNANARSDLSCHVFHPSGGRLSRQDIPDLLSTSELQSGDLSYLITGSLRTSLGVSGNNELALMIVSKASTSSWGSPSLKNIQLVCEKLNKKLGHGYSTNGRNILTAGDHSTLSLPEFDGSFSGGQTIATSEYTGCYSDIGGSNRILYYHVLLVR